MDKFIRLTAKACPLDLPNVNTDQILPARFLKVPRSVELGRLLFYDLRRDADGVMTLLRIYRFEFSDTGDNRRDGDVTLLGKKVEWVRVGDEMMEGGANVVPFQRTIH